MSGLREIATVDQHLIIFQKFRLLTHTMYLTWAYSYKNHNFEFFFLIEKCVKSIVLALQMVITHLSSQPHSCNF